MEQDVSRQKKTGESQEASRDFDYTEMTFAIAFETVPKYKDATREMSFFSSFDREKPQ